MSTAHNDATANPAPLGLMGIPPEDQDSTPHFATLAQMAADHGLQGLSMGMSGDFEAAIAFHGSFLAYCICALQLGSYGATLVVLMLEAGRGGIA